MFVVFKKKKILQKAFSLTKKVVAWTFIFPVYSNNFNYLGQEVLLVENNKHLTFSLCF